MRKLLSTVLCATTLAGCASNPYAFGGVSQGSSRDTVIARLGAPTAVSRLPQGERLQYSTQPFGREAWMVDLDGSGKVTGSAQVLTEQNFNRIQPGWTRDDVEREFGRPAWIERVSSWSGPVMTYRWRDPVNTNMFYWVYLDERNIVQRSHPGIEFTNGPNDRN